ncbi:MAG: TRAP transporter small permease [Deltaproteobacteria bacterium]|nr:TRAP transporter small permease [Deltaproteobacteria bacterium]
MESFRKTLSFISDKLKVVGAVFLFGMAVLTCLDVIGRLFKHPIFGSVELVSFMGVIAVACSLPFTHIEGGHIGVELVVRKFSRKTRNIIKLCTEVLSLILFSLVTWKMFEYYIKVKNSGELSMNLQLPEYWVIFLLGCGFVILTIAIAYSILKTISNLSKI